jgi:1-acyl-sn-glycerol-3-phosphate acyltransferase
VSDLRFEYRPMPDIDVPFAQRLGQYPRQPDLAVDVLRAIGRRASSALVRLQFPIDVVGHPPDLPRVALIANHQSHLDTLAILAVLPERHRRDLAVLAARDYFFERWPRAMAAALLGQGVAFDRGTYTELRRWIEILRDEPSGWFLAYPSGSRRHAELHSGLLLILARSGLPIVPVSVSGTARAWPVGARVWRPFRPLRVTFGDPITAPATLSLVDDLSAFWQVHAS